MNARRSAPWLLATLLVAAIVHAATLYAVPHLVMARALSKLGAPNTMHFGKRPDASSRGIVRPSPDLLYSVCPYDLSDGPLLVTAPVPKGAYWSVSAFDADTNNYFVRNDRQVKGALHLMIFPPGQATFANGSDGVVSPTLRGIVLFRAVIDSDAHLSALDAQRRLASCAVMLSVRNALPVHVGSNSVNLLASP
jgi:uncharacterized membrane protein